MKVTENIARILLVDDHPVVVNGYREMLERQPGIMVCSTITNAALVISAIERDQPDLVVLDLTMPGRSGLDLIKDLITLWPQLKILVFSMHDESVWAERVFRAGAKGYVMKESDSATMIHAVRQVLRGELYFSPQLTARILQAFASARPRGSDISLLEKLSDREFEVFRFFGEGRTAKEIAAHLNLSPKTVSVHRDHIKEKMGFVTSAEMIREAVRWVTSQA